MAAKLRAAGHTEVANADAADVVIVNTCGFIDRSKQESVDTILEHVATRREGQQVIAAGCLVQRYESTLAAEIPELDGLVGTREWDRIADLVPGPTRSSATERTIPPAAPNYPREIAPYPIATAVPELRRASSYLKIADGCSRPCAFCIIPTIKGSFNSKPADVVVAEARAMVEAGVQEVVLVAQDLTAYWYDHGGKNTLPALIEQILDGAPNLRWLRLMYAYPGHVTDDLIRLMAERPQVLPYLDIPLQHGHPAVLKRMKRPGLEVTERLLDRLKSRVPAIAIRTAFIVGFPGETDEEFATLVRFVERWEFDRLGVFTYSREEDTPAARLPGQVRASVKQARRNELMGVQQAISARINRRFIGRELDVLIEERVAEGAGARPLAGFRTGEREARPFDCIGRSYRDAPEVDGMVLCRGDAAPGEIRRVRVTDALAYDLVGEILL